MADKKKPRGDAASALLGGMFDLGQGSGRVTGANTGAQGSKGMMDYVGQGMDILKMLGIMDKDKPEAPRTGDL